MLNTIKNFKWFFVISIISVLLCIFTFITFINQNLFFLNEDNLQYLLILDVTVLIIFFLLLIKETSKLFLQYRSKKIGSKTSLNYVLQLSLFAFLPSLAIAIFSLILFNVGLQKYFDKKITSAVNNSYEVAQNYINETKQSVNADVFLVAVDLNRYSGILFSNPNRVKKSIRAQKLLRRLDEIYLLDSSGTILLGDTNNPETDFKLPTEQEFDKALDGKPVSIVGSGEDKTAVMLRLNNFIDTYLYISRDIQPQLLQYLDDTKQAVNFYYTVENNRTGIKITFAIIYIVIVSLLLFLTVVLAIAFAGRLTKPIINLVAASKNISSGKLDTKVPIIESDEEIKILNENFNNMIDRLKKQQDKLLIAERYSAWESVARKLAHEIKNPLTPIQLSIDRLKEKYSDSLKDQKSEFSKYLETINRQIIDIKKLVNEFSDFARMPRPILKKTKVDDILNRAINFYKMSDKNLNLFLKNKTKDNFYINADGDQLYRVFLNLIKNSMEAIEEKKQKDANLQGKITLEIDKNNEYIEIKMLDNGTGFNDIKNITKPYYTTKKNGTGLGLPIVSKIINDHNGEINFIKNSKGAEITISLPIIR
ncbi:MAG: two-component sensor histidine kinase [Candidatus Pelagibacter sp.]|nr:two-component sensor histidine kinase [Candidatus Pelagibacter sp.]